MREALAKMVASTEAHGGDSTEKHLNPAYHWHDLANDAVGCDYGFANSAMYALCKMELEVDADCNLDDKHEHERGGEGGVDVMRKLTTAMHMSEKVA